MKLTIVGCAGSFPSTDSSASCYLLEHEGVRVLLDLGSGSFGPLQRYIDPGTIDAVMLSHLHPDHFADMCPFFVMQTYHPRGPGRRIPIYGPQGTAARVTAAYGAPDADGMSAVFDFAPYPRGSFHVGPFVVTAIGVDHPVEAYALRVEAGGSTLVYSGDTAVCDGLIEAARGADLALFEASFIHAERNPEHLHMSAHDAATVANTAGVGSLVLTHLVAWHDNSGALAEAAHFSGQVRLAEGGMSIEI